MSTIMYTHRIMHGDVELMRGSEHLAVIFKNLTGENFVPERITGVDPWHGQTHEEYLAFMREQLDYPIDPTAIRLEPIPQGSADPHKPI